jgi:hypothetical protein
MAKYSDKLGPVEHGQFMQLAGYHPHVVGVRTHRDAVTYLRFIDARRRHKKIEQLALAMRDAPPANPMQRAQMLQRGQVRQAAPQPGLLGLVMQGRPATQ